MTPQIFLSLHIHVASVRFARAIAWTYHPKTFLAFLTFSGGKIIQVGRVYFLFFTNLKNQGRMSCFLIL